MDDPLFEMPAQARLRRLTLVTSRLGGGGAERIVAQMAEHWSRVGVEVTVIVLRKSDDAPEYPMPLAVKVCRPGLIEEKNPLGRPRHLWSLYRLRHEIERRSPDFVISFGDKLNIAVIAALLGSGISVVATEHMAPWMNPLGAMWTGMRRLTYRRAVAIVSPTTKITDWFRARMVGNFVTLPYPAQVETPERCESERRSVILGVGRLAPQKGFDLLIKAFSKIAAGGPEWVLEIAGEGPERGRLTEQIRRAGLSERIRLLGQVNDVSARLQAAAIFALSSRHEAFPMALCEAMAAGCCVVTTDCPTGPREIFTAAGVEVGVLVPPEDSVALADALERVMVNPTLRQKFGQAARAVAHRFGPGPTMAGWNALLEKIWSERP